MKDGTFLRAFLLLMLLWFFAFGCRHRQPQNILSESEIVKVLLEMYISDEKFARAGLPYDSLINVAPLVRERIFLRMGLTDSLYQRSMQYYMDHPDKLDRIFSALIDSLSLREQKIYSTPTTHDLPSGF